MGGGKASLSPDLIKIATEVANDEIDHVSPVPLTQSIALLPYIQSL